MDQSLLGRLLYRHHMAGQRLDYLAAGSHLVRREEAGLPVPTSPVARCWHDLERALYSVLKKMIPRPRPLTDFAPLIEAGKVHIHVLGKQLWYRSFPSGHTQTAFTAAIYLPLLLPDWTPLFIASAISVGLSRIYMGAHFPLDVIGGGLVGVALASGIWWLRKKLLKPPVPPQA